LAGGEEDADPGMAVRVGVVAQVGGYQVGRVDGDAEFLAGFAGCCCWEVLADI
jgi:hypothetical protein